MKIVSLSTSDKNGGAAISAFRVHQALRQNGMDAHMLVQDQRSDDPGVHSIASNAFDKKLATARYAWEKLMFLPYERDKSIRFAFSTGISGASLSKHQLVQQADIIHFNWMHQGFMSISEMERIFKLGKPIVWLLHDMWAFTGGCHYAGESRGFERECGNCPYLKNPGPNDLSHQIWLKKQKVYSNAPLTIVASSQWLAGEARKSSLFGGFNVYAIPTPINPEEFYPEDKVAARKRFGLNADKQYLLFGAMSLGDERKGFKYLKEGVNQLVSEGKLDIEKVELVIFGKDRPEAREGIPLKVNFLGQLSKTEDLRAAYNSADIFVLPSLEDNLPNTIIEALSCGVPSVAFDCTGVPEIITHEVTGYLAPLRSSGGVAKGIHWVLNHPDPIALGQSARQHSLEKFSGQVISEAYRKLYQQLLG
ncbi:glycosyltransferase family 4 protein [soil metagenome]